MNTLRTSCVILASVLASTSHAEATSASQDFEFHGYFRAGMNLLSDGGSANRGACFSLNYPKNDGIYYRLGNECRDYAEFSLTKNLQSNGVDFKAVWMMDIAGDSRSPTSVESWSRRSRQLYVEASHLLPDDAKLWIGRRYYRDIGFGDVHMIDMFHVQSSGNGFGVTDIQLGADNRMHVAAIGYGGENTGEDEINFENVLLDLRNEMDLHANGKLTLGLQNLFTTDSVDRVDQTEGLTFSVQWDKRLGAVEQKTTVQYATGSFAENPGCAGTDGGCFDYSADDSADGFRVFNNGLVHVSERFKINYMLMYQHADDYHTLASVGIRPHFALSDHWSVLAELGYNQYEREGADGVALDEQSLFKTTLALQATADASQFWARPAFRFYLSRFSWNEAAAAQSGLSIPGESGRNALLFGAQTEIWF